MGPDQMPPAGSNVYSSKHMPLIALPMTDLLSPGIGEPVAHLGSEEAPGSSGRGQDSCSGASAGARPPSLPHPTDQPASS